MRRNTADDKHAPRPISYSPRAFGFISKFLLANIRPSSVFWWAWNSLASTTNGVSSTTSVTLSLLLAEMDIVGCLFELFPLEILLLVLLLLLLVFPVLFKILVAIIFCFSEYYVYLIYVYMREWVSKSEWVRKRERVKKWIFLFPDYLFTLKFKQKKNSISNICCC